MQLRNLLTGLAEMRSEAAEIANRVFGLDVRIRWVGISNQEGVLFCDMRPGVQSVTPPETDRQFIESGALIVLSILEKFAPHVGDVTHCVTKFEKLSFLVRRLNDNILALSVEPNVDPDTIGAIDSKVSRILPKQSIGDLGS